MTRVEEAGLKIFSCGHCFGHWMANLVLQRRCRLDLDEAFAGVAAEQSLADLAEVVQASHTAAELRCPQCEKAMTKDKFHPMIPVKIDRCRACNTVWLDAGELSLIRLLHRELMTSDDPEILRRREKIAGAFVAWEGRERATDEAKRSMQQVDDGFDLLSFTLRGLI
jgi:Zn-finger nucleic acid-binding protein